MSKLRWQIVNYGWSVQIENPRILAQIVNENPYSGFMVNITLLSPKELDNPYPLTMLYLDNEFRQTYQTSYDLTQVEQAKLDVEDFISRLKDIVSFI